jgi:hypothetical protein
MKLEMAELREVQKREIAAFPRVVCLFLRKLGAKLSHFFVRICLGAPECANFLLL